MKYMQEICREAICETCWPLHLYKSAFVMPEHRGCKQHVVFSPRLSPVLASAMIKINVRSRCHRWILSSSFSSSRFNNIWIKWMTTVGHVCVSASQQSPGDRSSPPPLLRAERLHAASTSLLIHHCLFPFPPWLYWGLHSWPRGKRD